MVGIVLLAMVAAFLALRLYMVLGKRSGHEQALPPKPSDERVVAHPAARALPDAPAEPALPTDSMIAPGAAAGVRQIVQSDSGFDVGRFLEGAKGAYRMILEAFWRGDTDQLAWLTGDDVREAFAQAIAARAEAGEVLDNRLVSIERAVITAARVEGRQAFVTIAFSADIAAVTRDTNGEVIAGSLTDAVSTEDVWTFSRTLRSNDPNWLLVETDEAA